MEATKEDMSLLDKITPPKLEDAGLEDCALPLHSIHEAFLKAASAVAGGSRANEDDDSPPHDDLIEITPELDPPSGPCTAGKGGAWDASGDLVVGERNDEDDDVKKGDVVVIGGGGDDGERGGCVDEIKDLGIKETENGGGDDDDGDDEDKKKPTLIEGFFFNP
ncbi:uncharacterized protein LOC141610906 [Silene latifolia]|uniref:uncharacterized protein LOC141610906 n=1 Tax=Silene latifolia TaxID=37657 RepID=UPI003D78ADBE